MRKLLYPVVAMLLLGAPEPAGACTFFVGSKELHLSPEEQLYLSAPTVFVARVIRTEEAAEQPKFEDARWGMRLLQATLHVKEVLKGQPPADGRVTASAQRFCNVLLVPGFEYIIFLYDDNFVRPQNMGAYPLDQSKWEGERVLEKLRNLSKQGK